ncbi:MAG: molybdenum cofactor sulfurase, partial [Methylobacterium mesophilicum]|nr:molybdenum cofactor sulfurase [Methylobacterium mesophilicum]
SLTIEGIEHDVHAGLTRRSGSREPWYKRGTVMRNERQLTVVAGDELAAIAAAMDLPRIEPEWIGANILLDGVPDLSMLPSSSLIFFSGGVTLKVDRQNAPCRDAGRQVALRADMADRQAGELMFPKVAKRLRGLTAWVEKPGVIHGGESATVRVPEQWIY